MKPIEQRIDSREVAAMMGKKHCDLIRDIHRYEEQFAERNLALGDFFLASTYTDANNQVRPCYLITKKGCEFIAHKLTGVKGTEFTARYINRFHQMEDIIKSGKVPVKNQQETQTLRTFSHPLLGSLQAIMEQGEPWFLAEGAIKAIGYRCSSHYAINGIVDVNDVRNVFIDELGERAVVNQFGLQSLINGTLDTNRASHFKEWVSKKVLPELYKTYYQAEPQ